GHVVRGGRPSAFDRLLASRLAHVAVRAIMAGESRKMAGWLPPGAKLPEGCVQAPNDPHCSLTDLDVVLAETARLLDGTSPTTRRRRCAASWATTRRIASRARGSARR